MSDTTVLAPASAKDMPRTVWVALILLVAPQPLGLLYSLFFRPQGVSWTELVTAVVVLGLGALLAFGYGWVRHLLSAMAILCLAWLAIVLPQLFGPLPRTAIVLLLSNLCFFVATALLYSASARLWYGAERQRRQRGL
jgi:hypothetical protein